MLFNLCLCKEIASSSMILRSAQKSTLLYLVKSIQVVCISCGGVNIQTGTTSWNYTLITCLYLVTLYSCTTLHSKQAIIRWKHVYPNTVAQEVTLAQLTARWWNHASRLNEVLQQTSLYSDQLCGHAVLYLKRLLVHKVCNDHLKDNLEWSGTLESSANQLVEEYLT